MRPPTSFLRLEEAYWVESNLADMNSDNLSRRLGKPSLEVTSRCTSELPLGALKFISSPIA